MDNPLISVIVPIYNVEAFLDDCIKSIVSQTYQNLEIVLVDDGSPDNCPMLCDIWADKDCRIRVIHKKNGGISDARNAGLNIALGEYIAFVDSDDWIHEKYVETLFRATQEYDAKIAACDVELVYDHQGAQSNQFDAFEMESCTPEEAIDSLIKGRRFRAVVWNKLYHHSLLAEECFEIGRCHEDEFFTYRILDKADVLVYVDASLYYYRQRQGSITSTFSERRLDALDAFLERLDLLQRKYPRLYTRDKATTCIACAIYYKMALEANYAKQTYVRNRITRCRKRLQFTASEFFAYSYKQQVYILGTGLNLDLFCRLLIFRGKHKWVIC